MLALKSNASPTRTLSMQSAGFLRLSSLALQTESVIEAMSTTNSSTDTKVNKRKKTSKEKPIANPTEEKSKKLKNTHLADTNDVKTKPGDKFGPVPQIPHQRVWTRGVMLIGVFAVVYFSVKDKTEVAFARQKDKLLQRAQDVPCSDSYKAELEEFPGCVPSRCGRVISDTLVTTVEADALFDLAKRGLALGSNGAAAILDLHSGALSFNDSFVNFYRIESAQNLFKKTDFDIYKLVKTKIHHAVAHHFQVETTTLHLTHPTFFSRLTGLPARTLHDEYWLPHIDKETYQSFHYTSLLYLNDYDVDFQGGRFVFVDKDNTNRTVEPRKGRVSMFTSGAENLHYVERVTHGVRYAITVSFTCDVRHAILDPQWTEH